MSKRNTNNCCVDGCLNKQKDSKLSFFTLPKERDIRNEWLKKIGRVELISKSDLKPTSYRLCSVHFDREMMSEVLIRKLLPGAVPNKFLPNQSQPSTSKCENDTSNSDVSTQTIDSYLKTISKNASRNDVNTQTVKVEKEQQAETIQTLSSDTPTKRKLDTNLQASEKKKKNIK